MKRVTPGTVTIGVLAILFGLAAAYGARRYLTQPLTEPTAARPATVAVVVPRVNLPKYARIREQDVDVAQVSPQIAPKGAVALKSRALFRLTKVAVLAGQPLLEENLYPMGEVPTLADQLAPGYRAVTLSVDAGSALNGMILPESLVDINMTVKGDRPELNGLTTLTVMRSVKVLATSEARFSSGEERQTSQLRNITVAATPEQANKLILAQRYGSLSVTLVSTKDPALTQLSDDRAMVNPSDLLGLLPIPAAEEPVRKTAQIWRGGTVKEVVFDGEAVQEAENATALAEGREPEQVVPASSQSSASADAKGSTSGDKSKSGKACKNCGKKGKSASTGSEKRGEPTAARPQPVAKPASAVPTGLGAQRGGQTVEVQARADQTGAADGGNN
jgi:pilus assembly protein CpaB